MKTSFISTITAKEVKDDSKPSRARKYCEKSGSCSNSTKDWKEGTSEENKNKKGSNKYKSKNRSNMTTTTLFVIYSYTRTRVLIMMNDYQKKNYTTLKLTSKHSEP